MLRTYVLGSLALACLLLGATLLAPLTSGVAGLPSNIGRTQVEPLKSHSLDRAASPASLFADDWPMYMSTASRSSTNPNDTAISPANASALELDWSYQAGGALLASPIIAGGLLYIGAGNGVMYAFNATTGSPVWERFLGTTATLGCSDYYQHGITSAPEIHNGTLYVGGGNSSWYALNSTTGSVLWNLTVGNNSNAGGNYNWASALVFGGYLYIGTSSLCDQPLIDARLLQVSLTTHEVVHEFNTSTGKKVGASIWGSPTLDPKTGTIFFATGNAGQYGESVVAVNASNVSRLVGHWFASPAGAGNDSEFGNTPILANTSTGHGLVIVSNKNGLLYALNETNLSAGPLWGDQIAVGGASPTAGEGPISPSTFNGKWVFAAAGKTTIGGNAVAGSIRAINPNNGAYIWQYTAPGHVLGAITYENGAILANAGNVFVILNATTGKQLFRFNLTKLSYSEPTVAEGRIYIGNAGGTLFSLEPNLSLQVSSFLAAPSEVTLGNSTTFTASAVGGKLPYTYTYHGLPPPCTGTDAATLVCTPTGVGTFTVEVVVEDASSAFAFANSTLTVVASQTTYTVSFAESGLPSGTQWSVILGGVHHWGKTPKLRFAVANGTYAFSVPKVGTASGAPSAGSVPVKGASVSVTVAFSTAKGLALTPGHGVSIGVGNSHPGLSLGVHRLALPPIAVPVRTGLRL